MTEVKLQSNYRTNVFRGIIGEERGKADEVRTGVTRVHKN